MIDWNLLKIFNFGVLLLNKESEWLNEKRNQPKLIIFDKFQLIIERVLERESQKEYY